MSDRLSDPSDEVTPLAECLTCDEDEMPESVSPFVSNQHPFYSLHFDVSFFIWLLNMFGVYYVVWVLYGFILFYFTFI